MIQDHEGLPFGEAQDGRLISIDAVERGLSCGMVCPQCRKRLVAKKGDILRHHFAHEADAACSGAAETLLHKLGKQIILDAKGIMLPALVAHHLHFVKLIFGERWFSFDTVEAEVWKNGIRPDIIGRGGERELAIEILVTHACGPEKIAFIKEKQIPTIEIDLSNLRHQLDSPDITEAVLRRVPRNWLFNARLKPAVAELRAAYEAEQQRAAAARQKQLDDQALLRQRAQLRQARMAAQWEADKDAYWERIERERAAVARTAAAQAEALRRATPAAAAELKASLRHYATTMLGADIAAIWMNQCPANCPAPADWLTDAALSERYWAELFQFVATVNGTGNGLAWAREVQAQHEASAS